MTDGGVCATLWHMNKKDFATDRQHLTEKSYKTNEPLKVRIRTHELYTEPQIDFVPWVLSHIPWRGDELVIDVGCGAGIYAAQAQVHGRSYVACDLSFGMVAGVQNASQKVNLDVQTLPIESATADVVLANHMLYHVPDKDKALQEIVRVLKPSGYLIAATNSGRNMAEMRQLMSEATTRLEIELEDPFAAVATRFDLETSIELLKPYFAQVERHDLPAVLVFPEPQPIIDYLASTRDYFELRVNGQATWAQAEQELRQMLDSHFAENATFVVNKLSGVFVCQKAA